MHGTLFHSGTVVIELHSTEKYAALQELIYNAPVFDALEDKEKFKEAVFARERILSTGLGRGVAFAHGKLPEIQHVKVALGISKKGIAYDSVDGQPVHLVFIVATNPSMHIDYLKCLSILASMARLEGFREEICSCCREEEITDKLSATYERLALA